MEAGGSERGLALLEEHPLLVGIDGGEVSALPLAEELGALLQRQAVGRQVLRREVDRSLEGLLPGLQ